MRIITSNGSTPVTWEMPQFRDNVGVKSVQELHTVKSGDELSWGTYPIVYVAYDEAGNAAECSFTIYVLSK